VQFSAQKGNLLHIPDRDACPVSFSVEKTFQAFSTMDLQAAARTNFAHLQPERYFLPGTCPGRK